MAKNMKKRLAKRTGEADGSAKAVQKVESNSAFSTLGGASFGAMGGGAKAPPVAAQAESAPKGAVSKSDGAVAKPVKKAPWMEKKEKKRQENMVEMDPKERAAVLRWVQSLVANPKGCKFPVTKKAFFQDTLKQLWTRKALLRQSKLDVSEVFRQYREAKGIEIQYQFSVDSADHCETPFVAYEDLSPLLKILMDGTEGQIYDPYFCTGRVRKHLTDLGFSNVYNKNEDFYKIQKDGKGPKFDVLVTNPPYSADHPERLLDFCRESGKPCCLLVPNYVYMKPAFKDWLEKAHFICPKKRYVYEAPKGTTDHAQNERNKNTRKTAPFASMWFLLNVPKEALKALKAEELKNGAVVVKYKEIPNDCRDANDPLKTNERKTTTKDGRLLCMQCGQVHGNCKHTRGK